MCERAFCGGCEPHPHTRPQSQQIMTMQKMSRAARANLVLFVAAATRAVIVLLVLIIVVIVVIARFQGLRSEAWPTAEELVTREARVVAARLALDFILSCPALARGGQRGSNAFQSREQRCGRT